MATREIGRKSQRAEMKGAAPGAGRAAVGFAGRAFVLLSCIPVAACDTADREAGEIEHSFLPIGVPEESRPYAASYTSVDAVLEGDTIWAVWALSDTLYKFDRDGSVIERFPLSLPRPMGVLPGAEAGVITDPRALQAAAESLTQVNSVFLLRDGVLAVQSMQARGFDAVWDLLMVDRRGAQVWSAARMPRLYAVVGDLFYFDDPASLLPNHWVVAWWRGDG
ncbi:MAG: hypothetical protein F4139_11690 [Gemmatimonadetes bacterium]|nr:hypothetical protein [Gemmatimonadota bacterium]MYH53584.1 hypothetical protein [Gemmatimonadota bacterium]MYK67976.1 hypothetical protein [Gemmatimonadota bacterium]